MRGPFCVVPVLNFVIYFDVNASFARRDALKFLPPMQMSTRPNAAEYKKLIQV
jgi:hypothetical protein